MNYILSLVVVLLSTISCQKVEEVQSKDSQNQNNTTVEIEQLCQYTEKQIYPLNRFTNTDEDFRDLYIEATSEIMSSSCEGVKKGLVVTQDFFQVARYNNGFGIVQDRGVDLTAFIVEQNQISLKKPITMCIEGIEIITNVTEGFFNNVDKEVQIVFETKLTANNCKTFIPKVNAVEIEGFGDTLDNEEYEGTTALYYHSDVGDFIGRGKERLYKDEHGKISASSSNNGNQIQINFSGIDGVYWSIYLKAANNEELGLGTYSNATRFPFNDISEPGFSFSGDGRGCNNLGAEFTINEIVFGENDSIERLNIDFRQNCENRAPAIRGTIRVNSQMSEVM